MNQSTAIILFARTAEAEMKEKNLSRVTKGNKAMLAHLRSHAIRVIKSTQLPYFIFSEEEQIGESFAEKISNAYQQIFDQGYQRVICIGADVPSITSEDLLSANRLLLQEDIVCGPTQCGGSYLFGINATVFDKNIFLGLAWQTNNLFSDITSKFEHCVVMEELPELNTAEQLHALKNSPTRLVGISNQLLQLAYSVLLNTKEIWHSCFLFFTCCFVQRPARAP